MGRIKCIISRAGWVRQHPQKPQVKEREMMLGPHEMRAKHNSLAVQFGICVTKSGTTGKQITKNDTD